MFTSWKSNGETPREPSLDGAIAFWTGKNPNQAYDWSRADICACGQYAKSIGVSDWLANPRVPSNPIWHTLNQLAADYPRDFGSLTARAKVHAGSR